MEWTARWPRKATYVAKVVCLWQKRSILTRSFLNLLSFPKAGLTKKGLTMTRRFMMNKRTEAFLPESQNKEIFMKGIWRQNVMLPLVDWPTSSSFWGNYYYSWILPIPYHLLSWINNRPQKKFSCHNLSSCWWVVCSSCICAIKSITLVLTL